MRVDIQADLRRCVWWFVEVREEVLRFPPGPPLVVPAFWGVAACPTGGWLGPPVVENIRHKVNVAAGGITISPVIAQVDGYIPHNEDSLSEAYSDRHGFVRRHFT